MCQSMILKLMVRVMIMNLQVSMLKRCLHVDANEVANDILHVDWDDMDAEEDQDEGEEDDENEIYKMKIVKLLQQDSQDMVN